MAVKNNALLIAAIANLIFFIVFYLLFHPILNTGEDGFILYQLAGGFGNPPTEVVQYNYIINVVLGLLIRNLFLIYDSVNWYSLILILGQYVSGVFVLTLLLKKTKKSLISYLLFISLYIIFEGYFMLFLDFTGASLVLASNGFLLLILSINDGNLSAGKSITALLFLVAASLFRVHTILPVFGISVPFLLIMPVKQERTRLLLTLTMTFICIFLLNLFHIFYYKKFDPNWEKKEAYRTEVYRFYNNISLKTVNPGEKWYIESQLVNHGLLIDSSVLSIPRLDSMYQDLETTSSSISISDFFGKWFFINNRIFFFISALSIILFGLKRKSALPLLLSLGLLIVGMTFLRYYGKLPPYILIISLYLVCLVCLLSNEEISFIAGKRFLRLAVLGVILFFIFWGVVRLYKMSRANKEGTELFRSAYKEIAGHRNILFILTDNNLFQKFYAFDLPKDFQLPNYLDSEHFLNSMYAPVLHKFNIGSIRDVPYSKNVLFRGTQVKGLKAYFEAAEEKAMYLSPPLKEFKYGAVWYLRARNE